MGLVVADFVDLPGEQDDGYPDVAVANSEIGQESVTVFWNTGDWSVPGSALVPMGTFALGANTSPYEVRAADVDSDPAADLDLIVTLQDSNQIVILENQGLGQFEVGIPIDISPPGRDIHKPRGLVVGDFDLDNRLDLAMGATDYNGYRGVVVLFWKRSDGDWDKSVLGAEHNMPWGYGTDIVAGAVVKKSVSPAFQDLVVAVGFHINPYLVTLVNLGQRQFAPGILSDASPGSAYMFGPNGIALGHFRTGVIQPDLVSADEFHWDPVLGDSADVFWNDAFGNYTFKHEYMLRLDDQLVGHDPFSVAVAKINADTKQDIVCTIGHDYPCAPGGGIAVFVGNGDGTFVEPPYLFCVDPIDTHEPKPKFVEVVDMDQNGFLDVVTSNYYEGDNISVLLNGLEAIPPAP